MTRSFTAGEVEYLLTMIAKIVNAAQDVIKGTEQHTTRLCPRQTTTVVDTDAWTNMKSWLDEFNSIYLDDVSKPLGSDKVLEQITAFLCSNHKVERLPITDYIVGLDYSELERRILSHHSVGLDLAEGPDQTVYHHIKPTNMDYITFMYGGDVLEKPTDEELRAEFAPDLANESLPETIDESTPFIERVKKLARMEEREACLKIIDNQIMGEYYVQERRPIVVRTVLNLVKMRIKDRGK